jgi:hypothetical protein
VWTDPRDILAMATLHEARDHVKAALGDDLFAKRVEDTSVAMDGLASNFGEETSRLTLVRAMLDGMAERGVDAVRVHVFMGCAYEWLNQRHESDLDADVRGEGGR